jgi:hypothetical protein
VEAGQVTVHRLLWEYGRDTFGDRAGKSFSEVEWRAWLAEIARRYRGGIQEFSVKSLGETASRPDLSEREVQQPSVPWISLLKVLQGGDIDDYRHGGNDKAAKA